MPVFFVREKWLETYKKSALNTKFETSSFEVDALYTPETIPDLHFERDLGYPSFFPYTRGIYPTMYRGRLWTMRQYAGFASAEESNRRFKFLLAEGQTGLSVAFDLPTQIGYDSDHPLARGEVGRVGVPVDSLADMEILFEGIPLERVSTSMTINAPAAILLAMYITVAEKQGVPMKDISGTIQNDILKEYIARGTYIFPPAPSMRLTCDIFEFCATHLPKFNTISISGYHIREAGATAVQELAFTLANAITYVSSALERGLGIDDFGPRLSFFFGSHNDLFEEAAKFRAARRMWARIMKDRFGAQDEGSYLLRFHTQTDGCTLTAQQPENNIVRVTIQALAAILGGTQSLHTNSMDEALSLPSEKAVQTALRTQQILAYESGVINTIDPLAGSYYIESLTNRIENEAGRYIERIEKMGGVLHAIETGFLQTEIAESAYRYQKSIEEGSRVIVGVNKFKVEKEEKPMVKATLSEDSQIGRLNAVRERRDNSLVVSSLGRLSEAAHTGQNLMPHILEAVEAYATIGEICDVLREEFGEYKPRFSM